MAVEYVDNGRLVLDPLPWQKAGLQQTATGYGSKLTTAWRTEYNGRLYRVYSFCFSNASTPYILVKGRPMVLRNTTP